MLAKYLREKTLKELAKKLQKDKELAAKKLE